MTKIGLIAIKHMATEILFNFNCQQYNGLVGNQKNLVAFKLEEWRSNFFSHQLSTQIVATEKNSVPIRQRSTTTCGWYMGMPSNGEQIFLVATFFGYFSFGGTLTLTSIRSFKISFFLPFFLICMTLVVLHN